jgi:mRNA-degrading endonuclease RelE of RelBE toxin-antitoxin system
MKNTKQEILDLNWTIGNYRGKIQTYRIVVTIQFIVILILLFK